MEHTTASCPQFHPFGSKATLTVSYDIYIVRYKYRTTNFTQTNKATLTTRPNA
jgi:hypothetical protein